MFLLLCVGALAGLLPHVIGGTPESNVNATNVAISKLLSDCCGLDTGSTDQAYAKKSHDSRAPVKCFTFYLPEQCFRCSRSNATYHPVPRGVSFELVKGQSFPTRTVEYPIKYDLVNSLTPKSQSPQNMSPPDDGLKSSRSNSIEKSDTRISDPQISLKPIFSRNISNSTNKKTPVKSNIDRKSVILNTDNISLKASIGGNSSSSALKMSLLNSTLFKKILNTSSEGTSLNSTSDDTLKSNTGETTLHSITKGNSSSSTINDSSFISSTDKNMIMKEHDLSSEVNGSSLSLTTDKNTLNSTTNEYSWSSLVNGSSLNSTGNSTLDKNIINSTMKENSLSSTVKDSSMNSTVNSSSFSTTDKNINTTMKEKALRSTVSDTSLSSEASDKNVMNSTTELNSLRSAVDENCVNPSLVQDSLDLPYDGTSMGSPFSGNSWDLPADRISSSSALYSSVSKKELSLNSTNPNVSETSLMSNVSLQPLQQKVLQSDSGNVLEFNESDPRPTNLFGQTEEDNRASFYPSLMFPPPFPQIFTRDGFKDITNIETDISSEENTQKTASTDSNTIKDDALNLNASVSGNNYEPSVSANSSKPIGDILKTSKAANVSSISAVPITKSESLQKNNTVSLSTEKRDPSVFEFDRTAALNTSSNPESNDINDASSITIQHVFGDPSCFQYNCPEEAKSAKDSAGKTADNGHLETESSSSQSSVSVPDTPTAPLVVAQTEPPIESKETSMENHLQKAVAKNTSRSSQSTRKDSPMTVVPLIERPEDIKLKIKPHDSIDGCRFGSCLAKCLKTLVKSLEELEQSSPTKGGQDTEAPEESINDDCSKEKTIKRWTGKSKDKKLCLTLCYG